MKYYISVDLGGTALKYAWMNEEAEILEHGEVPSPKSAEALKEDLMSLYRKYGNQAEALVMSAPGRIDSARSYFYTGGALTYLKDVSLAELLQGDMPLPLSLENDAKAAALAEMWKGSMKGIANGTVIVIGTGLGGSIIIDGKLYRGTRFTAGEYSFLSGNYQKPYRLETSTGMEGVGSLLRRYGKRVGEDPETLNGRIFFERAGQGQQEALDALHEYCSVLTNLILSLQAVLDTERVAVGGGISRQPLLIEVLKEEVHQAYKAAADIVPYAEPDITACTFGNDANLIGALYHFLYEMR
jgi:predicted NBD/HSP70 family sugar kinase